MSKSVLSAGSLLILRRNARRMIVRGLRASQTLNMNCRWHRLIVFWHRMWTPVFLTTRLEYAYLSSTIMKEVAAFGGDIHKFAPDFVEKEIREKVAEIRRNAAIENKES